MERRSGKPHGESLQKQRSQGIHRQDADFPPVTGFAWVVDTRTHEVHGGEGAKVEIKGQEVTIIGSGVTLPVEQTVIQPHHYGDVEHISDEPKKPPRKSD